MFTLEIVQDMDPPNPVAEGHLLSTLAMFHRRYILGDQNHGIEWRDFNSWDDMEAHIRKTKDVAAILPIYMYDHSGITISHQPFNCQWDSGQVGFGYITKQQARDFYTVKRVTKLVRELAEELLISEIKEYDMYLTGDAWGYVIKDRDGEEIEACWGTFGRDNCEAMGNESLARLQS